MTAIDRGQRWFRAAEGPALVYTHKDCGQNLRVQLTCDQCKAVPRGTDVSAISRTRPLNR